MGRYRGGSKKSTARAAVAVAVAVPVMVVVWEVEVADRNGWFSRLGRCGYDGCAGVGVGLLGARGPPERSVCGSRGLRWTQDTPRIHRPCCCTAGG